MIAAPGNVERTYATKVGAEPATLTKYLEAAKKAVHEEAGFLEFELAANTEGPSGTIVGATAAQKYVANVNDISNIIEY
jgi:hypothetical protein